MAKKAKPKRLFKQTVTIKTNEEKPEPMELVAKSIIEISNAFEKINKAGLKERAIILLLHDATGIGMMQIQLILRTAPKLKTLYLEK